MRSAIVPIRVRDSVCACLRGAMYKSVVKLYPLVERDVKVERVMRGGDLLQITMIQKDDPGAGSLTLGFTENPLALKKWRVVDAQKQVVEVELFQLETGLKLDPDLFVFHDPKPKKRYND